MNLDTTCFLFPVLLNTLSDLSVFSFTSLCLVSPYLSQLCLSPVSHSMITPLCI